MTKTTVIHQPDFLPYLGFFHRLIKSDLLIFLDHVQLVTKTSRSWTHRDKIKTPRGEQWITISTLKAPLGTPINAVQISRDSDWKTRHLNLLRENYKNAPYFTELLPYLETLYEYKGDSLSQFNELSIKMLLELFDITIETRLSSEMDPTEKSNALLVDLLKKSGADHYLSGVGAKDYFDPVPFDDAQIKVVWQDFTHPVYPQQFGEFIPYLSSIDLLFNCGIEESRTILRNI